MQTFRFVFATLVCFLGSINALHASVIVNKIADVGAYWNPLSGSGTYVYANSFVFNGTTGTTLDTVGIYMQSLNGTGTLFRFEVYGDVGNAPDPLNVLGVSNYLQSSNTTLSLITAALNTPVSLVNGDRYWIAGSTVGQADMGSYQVGGHTSNSIYADNGRFWYSNDSNGLIFDGSNLTPEMAIYAETNGSSTVPEPSSLLVFGSLLGLAMIRSKLRLAM